MTAVRALRVHGRDDLRLDDVPAPSPTDDEAVVRVRYGGVCGSDVHYWRDGAVGTSVLRGPMTLGHEVSGTVARAAADGSGPAPGEAVVIHPAQVCGACEWCRRAQPNLCAHLRYLGSAARWPHTDGAFTDEIAIPTGRLVGVPPGVPLRRAALAEPAAVAWHAVARAEAVNGRVRGADVLVVGGGPIGLLVAAVAADRGAASTTVVDIHERPLSTARAIGVTTAVHASALAAGDALSVDTAFESSGSVAGLNTALAQTRRGGTAVIVGQLPAGELPVAAAAIVAGELTVTGSLRIGNELDAVLEFLTRAGDSLDPLITDVIDADDALRAVELAADPTRSTKVLLDFGAGRS